MRTLILLILGCMSLSLPSFAEEQSYEAWLGTPREASWNLGFQAAGVEIKSKSHFAPILTISKKISDKGFLPVVNNQLFMEAAGGPVVNISGSAFYSTFNMRWDIEKSKCFTPYAVLGLSASYLKQGNETSITIQLARTGLGLFWRPFSIPVGLRVEAGTSLSSLGLTIDI